GTGGASGEDLPVQHATGCVHAVRRPLERNLVVRPHPGVERDRRERGLEVEIVCRRSGPPERGREPRLEIEAACEPGSARTRLGWAEPELFGNVADALDARGAEPLEALASEAGKAADDPVDRLGGRAVRPELAVVRIRPVPPRP